MKIFDGREIYVLWHKHTKLVKHKYWEFQLSFIPRLEKILEFRLDFEDYPIFVLNLLGLFKLHISNSKKQDHAGFHLFITILGFDLEIQRIDHRHWDYDNDKWEEYGQHN